MEQVQYIDWGTIDYQEAWARQEAELQSLISAKLARREDASNPLHKAQHKFIICEHPHVYTLGKSGSEKNLLRNAEELKTIDASYYKINRGGDITYHGPGQIVGYPILDLDMFFNDIHRYMRCLEETIIRTLHHYDITATRLSGLTGVWLMGNEVMPDRKICAMGVRLSRWVTMHGFALNANVDLKYFNHIIPCGINEKAVTSMQAELHKPVNMGEVKMLLKKNFAEVFEAEVV